MQRTSWDTLDWMKHKLESRLLGEVSITSDMQMMPALWRKWRRTKEPLDESERGEWKTWLNIQKTKIMASDPSLHDKKMEKQWKQWQALFFGGSKITVDGDCSHEIKRHLFLGSKVMTNLDSILKSRDTTLSTKVHLVKAMVFPVVMYGCESWTIKKAECWRIDAFELWLLEMTWESLGLQGDPTSHS